MFTSIVVLSFSLASFLLSHNLLRFIDLSYVIKEIMNIIPSILRCEFMYFIILAITVIQNKI